MKLPNDATRLDKWHYTDAERNHRTQESWNLTAPLVDFKNAWIRDMLDLEQEIGTVTAEEGKRQWADCMRRADEAANQIRAAPSAANRAETQ
jgi:hypothetical protein